MEKIQQYDTVPVLETAAWNTLKLSVDQVIFSNGMHRSQPRITHV